jgi:LysR family hydrogen peroxide-inducible transcriptional activator
MVERNQGLTILPELATLDFDEERLNLIRHFKSPEPVREISLVSHKNFTKKGVLKSLKTSILDSLPQKVKEKKDHNILSV